MVTGCATSGGSKRDALTSEVHDIGKVKNLVAILVTDKADDEFAKGLRGYHQSQLALRGYDPIVFPDNAEFKTYSDAQGFLRSGMVPTKANEGGFGGAENSYKTDKKAEGALVVEVSLADSGESLWEKTKNKVSLPGSKPKANDKQSYSVRVTLLDRDGKVVSSMVDTIDKAKAEKYGKEMDKNTGKGVTKNYKKQQNEFNAKNDNKGMDKQSINKNANKTGQDVAASQADFRSKMAAMMPGGAGTTLWPTYVGFHEWVKLDDFLPNRR